MSESCENCKYLHRADPTNICRVTRLPTTLLNWCGAWTIKHSSAEMFEVRTQKMIDYIMERVEPKYDNRYSAKGKCEHEDDGTQCWGKIYTYYSDYDFCCASCMGHYSCDRYPEEKVPYMAKPDRDEIERAIRKHCPDHESLALHEQKTWRFLPSVLEWVREGRDGDSLMWSTGPVDLDFAILSDKDGVFAVFDLKELSCSDDATFRIDLSKDGVARCRAIYSDESDDDDEA